MHHRRKKICQHGFTLIELLVVIAVVGVLAGAVIVMINPGAQLGRARNAQRKSDLRQVANAIEQYAVMNGSYPVGGWCDTAATGSWACTPPHPLQVLVTGGYIKKLPIDPRDNQVFLPCDTAASVGYLYYSDGVNYKILAHCGAEGGQVAGDTFNDHRTHAYQISSPGGGGY